MKYHSWADLLKKWVAGHQDLQPQRVSWDYRVEDDLLIWKEKLDSGQCVDRGVGVPVGDAKPRMFYYLISQWRGRLQERAELETNAGIPVMPFEMWGLLDQVDRPDLGPADRGQHDFAAFDHVRSWVAKMGNLAGGVCWRDNRIECANGELHYWRKYRGKYHDIFIADVKGNTIRLRGQTGRSSDVAWVRDAAWIAVSREMGLGRLPPDFLVGRFGTAGCGVHAVVGGNIDILPTPPYLTKNLEALGATYG